MRVAFSFTNHTKRRKGLPFVFLLNQAGFEPTASSKNGVPENRREARFLGRGATERESAAAQRKLRRRWKSEGSDEGSSPVTSTTKGRKGLPFVFLLNQAGFEPTASSKNGVPENRREARFLGRGATERESAAAQRKLRRRWKSEGSDEGSSPVTSTTKGRKGLPFVFLLNQAGFEPTTSSKNGVPENRSITPKIAALPRKSQH